MSDIHYEIQHVDVVASERVRALTRPGSLSTTWEVTVTLTVRLQASGDAATAGMILTDLEARLAREPEES